MSDDFNKYNYIGKNIQLWPGDTYVKFGKIINVDSCGFWVEITKSHETKWFPGHTYFISHSSKFIFEFVDDEKK